MTAFPVVPIAAAAPVRALASVSAVLGRWLKAMARVHRNRVQARALAQVDGRMLADMGITRADLRDAFSEPFWEDPTALLRERALERRLNRHGSTLPSTVSPTTPRDGVRRPRLDRPARHIV
ncbi:MAG: DUF1127 domain-containing protein [Pseudolabrys sp.]